MVLSDYHNSVASGKALAGCGSISTTIKALPAAKVPKNPLEFPPCQVSVVASSLLKTIHATLAMACDVSAHTLPSTTLYRTARELLDLFRAVVPHRHAEDLATLPRLLRPPLPWRQAHAQLPHRRPRQVHRRAVCGCSAGAGPLAQRAGGAEESRGCIA